ncbi:MAG TPA: aldehyde dehydrogenase family protein, partial [Saprospiraceae bacterium]|nr:aldehyde dehydrogenase family protein [Saprospiraceae bacterium]
MSANPSSQSAVRNYISGQFRADAGRAMEVISPLDGQAISEVPLSGRETLDEAVAAARRAFTSWSKATIKERVQVFFRFRNLLEKHKSELTELIRLENGKTYGEAEAEVLK